MAQALRRGLRVPRPRARCWSACRRYPRRTHPFRDGPLAIQERISCAHPARERRYVERAESVMLEPADIAVEERTEVVHAIFEHRQPIDSAAECEALPFIR